MSTTLEYLKTISTKEFVRKYDEMKNGVDALMLSLETLSVLTGKSMYREEFKKANSEPALYHLQRLISRWKEMRSLLEPYAYVKKLSD